MNTPEVSFSGKNISVGDRSWIVEHPILQALIYGEKIVVLYDPDSYTEKFGQFPNLVAFNCEGAKLWLAQLPTNDSGDRYYRIYLKDGLIADSIYSFACQIDESSGRIKSKVFYK